MKTKILHKGINFNRQYMCNEAVGITEDKITAYWGEVTCKNCLRFKRIRRRNGAKQN